MGGKVSPEKKRAYYLAHREEILRKGHERYKQDRGRILSRNLAHAKAKRAERRTGTCEICGAEPISKNLANDHSHLTGLDRGRLCERCNLGLGHFRDDVYLLKEAISYLNYWNARHALQGHIEERFNKVA